MAGSESLILMHTSVLNIKWHFPQAVQQKATTKGIFLVFEFCHQLLGGVKKKRKKSVSSLFFIQIDEKD